MAGPESLHNTKAGRAFDVLNIVFLGCCGLVTVLPFLYIIAGSFATEAELAERSFFIFPETFSLDAYRYIFSTPTFIRSMGVSVFITIVGTIIQLVFTFTMAYPLAKRHVKGRNLVLNLVIFAMLFSGGMIPTYLVVKSLGLLDSYWALILPMAINPFNLIIIKNFFSSCRESSKSRRKSTAARRSACFSGSRFRFQNRLLRHSPCFMRSAFGTIFSTRSFTSMTAQNGPCKWCCAR